MSWRSNAALNDEKQFLKIDQNLFLEKNRKKSTLSAVKSLPILRDNANKTLQLIISIYTAI
jgi:hypothetical protein